MPPARHARPKRAIPFIVLGLTTLSTNSRPLTLALSELFRALIASTISAEDIETRKVNLGKNDKPRGQIYVAAHSLGGFSSC